jgi:hypothetical protein
MGTALLREIEREKLTRISEIREIFGVITNQKAVKIN